jgi:uncharacterized protein YuzE
MRTLASTVPGLVAELGAALTADGHLPLLSQLTSARIDRCTYDEEADAGYIYLLRPAPSPHFANLAAPVAETIAFFQTHGFNIDVDHDGNLYGIELLGRPDIIVKLRDNNAL